MLDWRLLFLKRAGALSSPKDLTEHACVVCRSPPLAVPWRGV
jgi:hypothetical protein